MGTYGLHRNGGESVADILRRELNSKTSEVIAIAVKINAAYLAIRVRETGQVYAMVCSLTHKPKDKFNFFYKPMSEDMGPYYYGCPAHILDLLTETNDKWSLKWRRMCRESLENHKHTAQTGDTVIFNKPLTFADGHQHDTFELVAYGRRKRAFRSTKNDKFYTIPGWKDRTYRIVETIEKGE